MTTEDLRTGVHGIRRPWLPACIQAHGFDARRAARLAYVVVDEMVDGIAGITLSEWPAADGFGRLRFAGPDEALEVGVPLPRLVAELYEGPDSLERLPRVGDVFAASPPRALRSEEGAPPVLWDRPLVDLLGKYIYDLTAEARLIAKLAYYSANARVVSKDAAALWGVEADHDPAADDEVPARRVRVGPKRR